MWKILAATAMSWLLLGLPAAHAQLTNPILAPIGPSGIRVRIQNLVQMPSTVTANSPKPDDQPVASW